MNRRKRRKMKYLIEDVDNQKIIPEGTKVKLNIKEIKSHPNYKNLVDKYHDFIDSAQDKIFTVEYDANKKDKPLVVCLKEDASVPKWLFWVGELEVVDV